MAKGKITQVIGAVVDVEFPPSQVPPILNALTLSNPALGDEAYRAALDELGQLISKASRNLVLRLVRNGLRAVFADRPGQRVSSTLGLDRALVAALSRRISNALASRDAAEAQEGVRLLLRAHREQLLKRMERSPARPMDGEGRR